MFNLTHVFVYKSLDRLHCMDTKNRAQINKIP